MDIRIASLLASGTEIVCELGLGERLVAISHECDYPAEITSLPRVTRANIDSGASSKEIDEQVRGMCGRGEPLYGIDVGVIAELRPDVIVTQSQCDVCAVRYEDVVKAVEETPLLRGCCVVALNPTRLEHLYADVRAVAVACGVTETAEKCVGAMKARVAEVGRRANEVVAKRGRVRVACIEWIEPLMIAANWMPDLIEIAGGECGISKGGSHSGYTDWSAVRAFDPQVVVVMPCGFDLHRAVEESKVLTGMPGWGELEAVRNGRVYAVDGNALFNRSGPRMVDSLELLAGLLNGDVFGEQLARQSVAWRRLGG